MSLRILVLHGPNLALLAEREAGLSLDALDEALASHAGGRGAELTRVRSHHEGGLLEALEAHGPRADGVLVSPGVLAHTSWALREALLLLEKPAVEVQLVSPRKSEPWRARSLLEDAVEGRSVGGGLEAYTEGLDTLLAALSGEAEDGDAEGAEDVGDAEAEDAEDAEDAEEDADATPSGKTLGRKAPASQGAAAGQGAGGGKTLGRKAPAAAPGAPLAAAGGAGKSLGRKAAGTAPGAGRTAGLTREAVRERIAARLSGRATPEELAAWARGQYLALQQGAPAEEGAREQLETCLQALTLSATGKAKLKDERLVEMMAELER